MFKGNRKQNNTNFAIFITNTCGFVFASTPAVLGSQAGSKKAISVCKESRRNKPSRSACQ